MHTKPVDKWKAFWRGFASANPYASHDDDPEIARLMARGPEEAMAQHWSAVGNYLRDAMRHFDDERETKIHLEQQKRFNAILEKIRFQKYGQWFGVGVTASAFIIALIALLVGKSAIAIVALIGVMASPILHIFKR